MEEDRETAVVKKGIGPVEVYKLRIRLEDTFNNWEYHASSSDRFLPNGDDFLGENSKNLEILAKTIVSIFTPKEKITIINKCPSYESGFDVGNSSIHIDFEGIVEHYERLGVIELEILGREISKYRK